jgi:hypothetical protein
MPDISLPNPGGSRRARRRLIGGAVGTVGAAALPRPTRASSRGLDPSNQADVALIFRKLAYAMDERIGFWWLRGTRCALIETDLIPLWEMHIGQVFQTRDLPGGRFEVATIQTSFYTDIHTGERLRTFANPLTQGSVELPHYAPTVTHLAFDADGRTDAPAGPLASLAREARIGPAWVEGDEVWVEGDILLRGQAASGVRPIRVNDLTTYAGSVRDVVDPDMAMPLASQAFTDINIWPPWLGMGDRFSRCHGRKVASLEAMPRVWRESMSREFPTVTANFAQALRN